MFNRNELKRIKNIVKDVTKDKASAIKFLKECNIMNKKGELHKNYK